MPVLEAGARVWRPMAEVDSSGDGAHANWPRDLFALLVDSYLVQTGNMGWFVGKARSYLMDARGLMGFAGPWMQRIAADAGALEELRRCATH